MTDELATTEGGSGSMVSTGIKGGRYRIRTLRSGQEHDLPEGTIIVPDVSYWGSDNEVRFPVLVPVEDETRPWRF